jgi:hypothetical protein
MVSAIASFLFVARNEVCIMQSNIRSRKPFSREVFTPQKNGEKEESASYSTKLLEFRTNIKSIREHQLHSRFLRASTLKLLAGKNVPFEYFIEIQNPKTRLINDLIGVNYSDNEIERIVSIAVEIFLEEFENTGKVHNWKNISRFFIEDEGGDTQKISPVKDKIFKYSPPPIFNITPVPINEKQLREELQEMNKDLEKILKKRMLGTKVTEKNLKELFSRFGRMIFNCKALRESKCASRKGGKVRNESRDISCSS